ncbi:MAG: tetratricopeptide repeat protein [Clostridiales bacterium]|nr:tetratricopeptide repeat protein [Clostridiales bacterium]
MAKLDKYEYKLKLDQMKSLTAEKDYRNAAAIADTINWNKVKNVNALVKAGEIYENAGRYEESREILLAAYDRSPIGRMIIYRLAKVAIKMKNYDEAKDYYQEFVEIAPHDNLKYVLKYEIFKAEGADNKTLISILEELKEQEYTEEWAYELAYLYHKAGMSEKCVDACDELVLWFGDGPYVERALELKMLYQPLSKQQEEKYRQFRQKKEGVVEVRPEDNLESGEIVSEPVQIPDVKLSPERFNTQNLQEELQKSMEQIMAATEKEAVDDSMDNIKKLVEDIPYLQIPKEEPIEEAYHEHIETDAEIDNSLKINFKELLSEDYDGQISLMVPEGAQKVPQITGQMSIDEVLAEWEKTKRAAEVAMQEAEQRKLESAKARALQEAGDIMERLVDIIPKLDSGLTPKELLEEQYLENGELGDDKAAAMVANMNQILQEEIDRLSSENAKMDERLAAAYEPQEAETQEIEAQEIAETTAEQPQEEPDFSEEELDFSEEVMRQLTNPIPSEEDLMRQALSGQTQEMPPLHRGAEEIKPEEVEPEEVMAEELADDIVKEAAQKISEPETVKEESLPEIDVPEDENNFKAITSLDKELRSIFTYFVPIKGMEEQLCQAMTGAARRLLSGKSASTGNMIIQGGSGSGKTVLATSMVKALQKETGRPNGRIGKIEASILNQKDIAALLKKVAGGCLIIEKVGGISKEAATKLALLLESDTSGIFVIIEDTHKGIEKALRKDAGFAARFSEKVNIPIFTSDELVAFAKSYANELGYTIDEMGVLALYNSISNIQKYDRATTLTEVKDIVDTAIGRAERGGLKKAFSIITSRRYDAEDYIILREKDFGIKKKQ